MMKMSTVRIGSFGFLKTLNCTFCTTKEVKSMAKSDKPNSSSNFSMNDHAINRGKRGIELYESANRWETDLSAVTGGLEAGSEDPSGRETAITSERVL